MRALETTVYKVGELSDDAKQHALEKLYDLNVNHDWWDFLFDDAANIAELFGLDICQTRQERMDKTFFYKPTIYFSGFSSQGDGACFEGRYSYQKGGLKAVMDYAPKDEELHRIVRDLQNLQAKNFYKVTFRTYHRGHYNHENCMYLDNYEGCEEYEDDFLEVMRDFARWIYRYLEQEYDWRTSDEQIIESIEANEYEFTEGGDLI